MADTKIPKMDEAEATVMDTSTTPKLAPPASDPTHGLRRVPDKMPVVALLILIVEVSQSQQSCRISGGRIGSLTSGLQLGERFTYFGLSGPIQNYIKCVFKNPHALPLFWGGRQV